MEMVWVVLLEQEKEQGEGVGVKDGSGLGLAAGAAQEQIIIIASNIKVNITQEVFFHIFSPPHLVAEQL